MVSKFMKWPILSKNELRVYIVGGIIFIFLRMLLNIIGFALFHHPDFAMVLAQIYGILFLDFISYNFFPFAPLIVLQTFLQGGMLLLFIAYSYYNRKAIRREGTINPISKKSLFIAVTIFIGFVWLTAMIVWWVGGFLK